METAPIILFVYNRLDTLAGTVRSLQRNSLAAESELFIFSDHPRSEKDATAVAAVRKYIRTITGFRRVCISEAPQNMGLARSVINGVSEVINRYGTAIVVEDDLVCSTNFLSFMNQALKYYRNDTRIFSVGGYTKPMKQLERQAVYFTLRASSWGWGTWKDRWNAIDWTAADYASFSKDRAARRRFNRMGSDMSRMLDRQMNRTINSWAILWCYHQFKTGQLTVFPAVSKICNEGFSAAATHTKDKWSRFRTVPDQSGEDEFRFTDRVQMDRKIVRRFTRTYSVPTRIAYKILNLFSF
jgi:Glycosyl transferase family 2